MRKRRVGVTARSRQIEGSRVTGFLQIDTEMAAPLELRTPIGTYGGEGRNQSADGSMATMARESTGRMQSQGSSPGKGQGETRQGDGARNARMRRRLILRQGASPLRPPAPFPSGFMFQNGGDLSRARRFCAACEPLTDRLRSED